MGAVEDVPISPAAPRTQSRPCSADSSTTHAKSVNSDHPLTASATPSTCVQLRDGSRAPQPARVDDVASTFVEKLPSRSDAPRGSKTRKQSMMRGRKGCG